MCQTWAPAELYAVGGNHKKAPHKDLKKALTYRKMPSTTGKVAQRPPHEKEASPEGKNSSKGHPYSVFSHP